MKFLAPFLILFLFLPLTASALSAEDCNEGTGQCTCYPIDKYGLYDDFNPADGSCIDWCKTISDKNTTGVSSEYGSTYWSYECNINGSLTSVEWGSIIDEFDELKIKEYEDAEFTIPRLGLEYPGLNSKLSNGVRTFDFLSSSFWTDSEGKTLKSDLLGKYIQALYSWMIAAGTLVAVVLIMVGGLQWSIARGNASAVEKAKDRIVKAIFGLAILMGVYSIAFLIDPNLTVFETLDIKYIDRTEWFPLSEEGLDMNHRADISGDTEPIQGIHLVLKAKNSTLHPDAVTALQIASDAFYEKYQKDIVVTSATRDIKKQAELFYKNCLNNFKKTCSVPTCNPAHGSSIITKNNDGSYTLNGDLTDETNSTTIINALVQNANPANCPHTSTIAVDIFCNDGGANFKHDPKCQTDLTKIMIQNGWCRISSEAWHFELNSLHVCSSCSTANNNANYTRGGVSYIPDLECMAWDFKNNNCADN